MRQHIKSKMVQDDEGDSEPFACAVQYINSVWHWHYPPSDMGRRNAKELRLLGVWWTTWLVENWLRWETF